MPQSIEFNVTTQLLEGGIVLLEFFGEVDILASPKIKDVITNLVQNGQEKVIVSLEKIGYIDSSGLGVLLSVLKKIREINGHLCLVCNNPQILKIFEITGLVNVFEICKCCEEGVENILSTPCVCEEPHHNVFWYGGEKSRRVKL